MVTKLENFLATEGAKLIHSGVKGMRWGFRRTDAQLATAAQKRSEAPDAVRAQTTLASIRSKGGLSAVSDADLNHLVNRLNIEKRYAEINPSSLERGHNFINSSLKVGTTMNSVIKFANSPAGHLLTRSLNLSKTTGRHVTPVQKLLKTAGGKKKK